MEKYGNVTFDQIQKATLAVPQTDLPVVHIFLPGIYVRRMFLKAGCWIVGHYHKQDHLCRLIKGEMSVMIDGRWVRMKAPMDFKGKPGRKIAVTHEDMIFENAWFTDIRDVETLEEILLDKTEYFNEAKQTKLAHDRQFKQADRLDYKNKMLLLGLSEEKIQELVNINNVVDWPPGEYKVKLGDSPIDGKGIMATADIEAGEVIGIARLGDDKRTPLGRFTNHSATPNAKMVLDGDNMLLVATQPIKGCYGGYDGEEVTTCYAETIKMLKGN